MSKSKGAEVVTDVEQRAEVIRKRLLDNVRAIEEGYVVVAKDLLEAHENGYYLMWGYSNFKNYCHEELGVRASRARYFVLIARAMRQFNLDVDRIISIGWTKMREIVPLLTDNNYEAWLNRAEEVTADQLRHITRDAGPESKVEELGTPKIYSLQLRMSEDEHSIITDAIDRAKDIAGTDSAVTALEVIAYDWIQQSADGPVQTDLATVLKWIEKVYGVALEPVGGQNVGEMLDD